MFVIFLIFGVYAARMQVGYYDVKGGGICNA